MGVKNIDGNLTAFQKFKIWFGERAVFLTILALITNLILALLAFVSIQTSQRHVKTLENIADKLANYVIVLTPDGRVEGIEKQPVGNLMERVVKTAVLDHFILSRVDFLTDSGTLIPVRGTDYSAQVKTNRLTPQQIEFLKVMVEYSPKIKELADFFDVKNPTSLAYYYVYVAYLYNLARASYLPDIIYPVKVLKSEYQKTGENTFRYSTVIRCKFAYYDVNGNVHFGYGNISYDLTGYYDITKATPVNPFGIKVLTMKFSYIDLSQIQQ